MKREINMLKSFVEDLIILSINAEMEEYEPMRVLASEIREVAERMKSLLSEIEKEEENEGNDSG